MPRRAKKTVTDLSYGLRRTWRRVHVATPSPYIVALLVTSICIFILGGGIYDLLEKPIALIPLRGRWIFYYPTQLHMQVLNESLIVMLLYALGVGGLILAYHSTKYEYRPRQAYTTLMLGVIFIFIAFLALEFILGQKLGSSLF